MIVDALRSSLRAKLLAAVVVCVVLPLTAVGAWLSFAAMRAGELLLRTQLDSVVAHAADAASQRWTYRVSDVTLLASNTPLRQALVAHDTGDSAPAYVRSTFATLSGLSSVTVRDARGNVRWTLTQDLASAPMLSGDALAAVPALPLDLPIRDDAQQPIGRMVARVRLDGLAPNDALDAPGIPQFVALHVPGSDAWLAPLGVGAGLLARDHFTWKDHRWLAVRRTLESPRIEIVAAGLLDPYTRPFARMARIGATANLLCAFGVVVLALVVTSRVTSSVGELAAAADDIAAGNLDRQATIRSSDEVARVARAFNQMVEKLRQMMRELSQREAFAAMGELSATIAHQLRSPATAIRLDVQRAYAKCDPDSPQRALLARALTQLQRMDRAIAASLRIARDSGGEFTDIDVRDPVNAALVGAERDYPAIRFDLHEDVVARAPIMSGHAPSLEQLFGNLLSNAAHAASEVKSGAVNVVVQSTSKALYVRIEDNGPGMAADVLRRAGEPAFSTKAEGTGLGLAIARRIAEGHGARMTIESQPGRGTMTTVARLIDNAPLDRRFAKPPTPRA